MKKTVFEMRCLSVCICLFCVYRNDEMWNHLPMEGCLMTDRAVTEPSTGVALNDLSLYLDASLYFNR